MKGHAGQLASSVTRALPLLTSQTNNADLATLLHFVTEQRRSRRDATTKHRSNVLRLEFFGDRKDELLMSAGVSRVAALLQVSVRPLGVVGLG